MDKFEMLDAIIVQLDRLADMRGVERCAAIIDLTQRLGALKDGLKDEDKAHKKTIAFLQEQLDNYAKPPELKDGEVREGGEHFEFNLDPFDQRSAREE